MDEDKPKGWDEIVAWFGYEHTFHDAEAERTSGSLHRGHAQPLPRQDTGNP